VIISPGREVNDSVASTANALSKENFKAIFIILDSVDQSQKMAAGGQCFFLEKIPADLQSSYNTRILKAGFRLCGFSIDHTLIRG
jgi:hypothetical protein